jgi:hypothetical protein
VDGGSVLSVDVKEYLTMKTSKTFQMAQDEHDNDTATEQTLLADLDAFERLVFQAADDGVFTPSEVYDVTQAVRAIRRVAAKSFNSNRLVASLLCATAGNLSLDSEQTLQRLPALRLLPVRETAHEPEEDAAA